MVVSNEYVQAKDDANDDMKRICLKIELSSSSAKKGCVALNISPVLVSSRTLSSKISVTHFQL